MTGLSAGASRSKLSVSTWLSFPSPKLVSFTSPVSLKKVCDLELFHHKDVRSFQNWESLLRASTEEADQERDGEFIRRNY